MALSDSGGRKVSDPSAPSLLSRAYLGVGSSLSPEENILKALRALSGARAMQVTGISTFYRTHPLPAPGASPTTVAEDPDFLNGIFEIRTALDPEKLAHALTGVEKAAGRVRTADKYAPRSLDLDLLVYLPPTPTSTQDTYPPHRDIRTRSFVALPLFELAPDLLLPPDGTPLARIVATFADAGGTPDLPFTERLRGTLSSSSGPGLP